MPSKTQQVRITAQREFSRNDRGVLYWELIGLHHHVNKVLGEKGEEVTPSDLRGLRRIYSLPSAEGRCLINVSLGGPAGSTELIVTAAGDPEAVRNVDDLIPRYFRCLSSDEENPGRREEEHEIKTPEGFVLTPTSFDRLVLLARGMLEEGAAVNREREG